MGMGTLFGRARELTYRLNPFVTTDWPIDTTPAPSPRKQLEQLHPEIPIIPLRIHLDSYHAYLNSCWTDYPAYSRTNWHEKSLEHYLSIELMGGLQKDDVLMDVASLTSPFPESARNTVGCTVYHQDLSYPPGVRGWEVGSDAAELPFPDNALTKMTLHCSFEHFAGDADSRFIIEASRVLQPGGKVCIVPLYLGRNARVVTDPGSPGWSRKTFNEAARYDQEAKVVYKVGYREAGTFVRYYGPTSLSKRVLTRAKGIFEPVLYRIQKVKEVHPSCYLKWALVLTKT